MEHTNLVSVAHGLPDVWQSMALARVGNANIKIVKMDDSARGEETHAYDEVLVVLEGSLHLTIAGRKTVIRQHEMCVIPAGVAHGVLAGSYGCLMIIDPPYPA